MQNILQFANLAQYPQLVHGVANTRLGNMSYLWGEVETVRHNRQGFFKKLGIDQNHVVVASLVHGRTITEVSAVDWGKGVADKGSSIESDVLITDTPDTYLFLVVADCLALFFFDPVKNVCALAHAGWRGVEQQVPKLVVEYMVEHYDCEAKNIRVGFSPAIQAKSYTDKIEVVEQAKDPRWAPYLTEVNSEYQIDFVGYAKDQLLEAGVPLENIENREIDTRTSPDYFSYRRSKINQDKQGRFGCIIGLRV